MTAEGRHDAHYAVRTRLRETLRADLLGPYGGPAEVLEDDAPLDAYLTGILYPRTGGGAMVAAEILADEVPDVVRGDDVDTAPTDLGVASANQRMPSSMGMTFSVDTAVAETVEITMTAARYAPEDEHGEPVTPERGESRTVERQRERWRRKPVEGLPISVDLGVEGMHPAVGVAEGLELRVMVRRTDATPIVTVTVTLVNTLLAPRDPAQLKDPQCFFQPEMTVSTGTTPAIVERQAMRPSVDPERELSILLHRHAPSFAVGHGCSVAWEWTAPPIGAPAEAPARVDTVWTDFLPSHEVLLTESNPRIDDQALGMQWLGEAPESEVVEALTDLLDGYERWIDELQATAEALSGGDARRLADRQIRFARDASARMRDGVELLDDPDRPEIMRAFRLATLAMAQQRARSEWIADRNGDGPDLGIGRWRPFQIGFVLLCLRGIVDPDHPDRRIADLLWFPTGGGKTEAYLGLIAFTAFLRRIRTGQGGVTVLMRYTLRLLTLQQFERASLLICAMERVRVEDGGLGDERFSIGMWVGRSATPNKLSVAAEQLRKLQNGAASLDDQNPVQLQRCPWCGTGLVAEDYTVIEEARRMVVRCPGQGCDFDTEDGLPVHLVDESVYAAHPTLVIATVDKFASMPWRPETRALFNRDREGTPPPELIVQDELHLISGPLGTMTGLYETAVDVLAGSPKVVASTATIRRADEQISGLFDRQLSQFPPAGLDSRDSWFAVETAREHKASRRYLGVFTPNGSQATLLIRTYAALLDAAQEAEDDTALEIVDAYWTLVGYFNSLRLLSAAEIQVLDDVKERLTLLADRRDGRQRPIDVLDELSSRADSSKVPVLLGQLQKSLPDPGTFDVLLATNMISVGVDIDRLGLMAVMGQPQTTAEYIQATSRVGRRHPGLVVVMFNSARSRDRSHYEGFQTFHSALYREVESSSVTPYSAGARDRGLHAVVVALARILIPEAAENEAAARIEDFVDRLEEVVIPQILRRVRDVDGPAVGATRRHLVQFVEWWRDEAAENPELVYETDRGSGRRALLAPFGEPGAGSDGWETLWSLRDVDAESGLFIKRNRGVVRK